MTDSLVISQTESFSRLPHAPIVEAVMELRIAAVPWDEAQVTEQFKPRLPDYPNISPQREIFQIFQTSPSNAQGPVTNSSITFKGLRFQSADKLHVVQFNRDSF